VGFRRDNSQPANAAALDRPSGDLTGFYHWSPMHELALVDLNARPGGSGPYRFVEGKAGANLANPLDGSPASVRSAKFQVMTHSGDSGGPLFFNTSEGFKLAGTCVSARRADLKSAFSARPDVPCYLERWEPLKEYHGWIKAVLAGDLGKSRVLAFEGGVAKVETRARQGGDQGGDQGRRRGGRRRREIVELSPGPARPGSGPAGRRSWRGGPPGWSPTP